MTLALVLLILLALALAAALLLALTGAGRTSVFLRDQVDSHRAEAYAARAELEELVRERDASGFEQLRDQRIVANIRDGGAIRGVLTGIYDDAFVISHPEFVGRAQPQGIGAEVTISRGDAPMVQRFEASE